MNKIVVIPVAIQVNIQIIRIFHRMRELLLTSKELLLKMEDLEERANGQDEKIQIVFDYLKQFIRDQTTERSTIGFQQTATQRKE